MNLLQNSRRFLITIALVLCLITTTACGGINPSNSQTAVQPRTNNSVSYQQLERGNTAVGQDFGNWVIQASNGLVQDAYVRDNNKLGVVVTPQVRPNEVKPLARSLVQGFHQSFPERDLTVLMYAPDKQLILTARYDTQSQQVEYQ